MRNALLLMMYALALSIACFGVSSCSATVVLTTPHHASAPQLTPPEISVAQDDQKPVNGGEVDSDGADASRPEAEEEETALVQGSDDAEESASLFSDSEEADDFDIPIVFNEAVEHYIRYFTTQKRKVFATWLRRARAYAPMIRAILEQQGLPEDLVYLAMIESGLNPKAYSRMKASGPWQFIHETGRRYGLRVDHWVDERRDIEKSTVAAAKYLKDLFDRFGCWYLAAAGYNAGENRVEKAIKRHGTTDFWELREYKALPRETREYIPQLIAAATVAKDPERFGLREIEYGPPLQLVTVSVPGGTPLSLVARSALTDSGTVKSLNPHILTGITPPDEAAYRLTVPSNCDQQTFQTRLAASLDGNNRVVRAVPYRVVQGDTLAKISRKFMVTTAELRLVNRSGQSLRVKRGNVIYVPRFDRAGPETVMVARIDDGAQDKASPPGGSRKAERARYHTVQRGESLAEISEMYDIDIHTLKQINGLKGNVIHPNMKLRLVSYHRNSAQARTQYHVVKKGESLSQIADKYGMNLAEIKQKNKLHRTTIYPGMRLRVSRTTP